MAWAGLMFLAGTASAGAQTSREPRITLDAGGTRIIALANMSEGDGCMASTDTGRVTKRHLQKGELAAITFKDARYESYINLPDLYDIKNRQLQRRVSEALDAMLVIGSELRIGSFACGAAGRMVYLDAVALINPPAPPAQSRAPAAPDPRDPQFTLDAGGTRVVSLSNLPSTTGCIAGVGTGRVVARHVENGVVRGISFAEPGHGESHINIPQAFQFRTEAIWKRVAEALNSLLVEGVDLRLGTVACGAAGRIVKLTSVALVGSPARTPAERPLQPARGTAVPRFERGPTGTIMAMSGLWRGADCPASVVAGTIDRIVTENRMAYTVTVKVDRQNDISVQMPEVVTERDAALKANLIEAFASLIKSGNRLRLTLRTCADGAGRTVHLDAASFTSQSAAAPPAATSPMGWRIEQPTPERILLEVPALDRAFSFTLACMRNARGTLSYSGRLEGPRNWTVAASATIRIDGRALNWEVAESGRGAVVGDAVSDGQASLSDLARLDLRQGQQLVDDGTLDRGSSRAAIFDISGGAKALADHESRCEGLPLTPQVAMPAPLSAQPAPSAVPQLGDADDTVFRQAPEPPSENVPLGVWREERPQERPGRPARAPSAPTKWKVAQTSKVQVSIEVSSSDRAFGWSIDCSRNANGSILFSNWFLGPRNWSALTTPVAITIDGNRMNWDIGGADEGIVLSDIILDNTVALSPEALARLARGTRLVIGGKTDRGRPRDAVFDISAGEAAFASFEARCQRLPRR